MQDSPHINRSRIILFIICLGLVLAAGCRTSKPLSGGQDDGKLALIILQMNDVYEIAPLSGGRYGGLARVATIRQRLLEENPNVITVIAGDFLNPSLIATIEYEGERIRGKQMVEVLNALGTDLAVFGNHEFDLDPEDLQQRINESGFLWLGTNLRLICGELEMPFFKEKNGEYHFLPDQVAIKLSDSDGTRLTLGFFGGCLPANPREYVKYYNLDSCAAAAISKLKDQNTELVLGLTHQGLEDDVESLKKFSQVPLIMGGHEHENHFETIDGRAVTKADANAKTVYIHRIQYDKKTDSATINSELYDIDDSIQSDPKVKAIVDRWQQIMLDSMAGIYPDPYKVIFYADPSLDGREVTNRVRQTNMGSHFARAMMLAAKSEADAAIVNSGSIRIDDVLETEIRPYDIFRALPFGGGIVEVDMKGKLLKEVLEQSEERKGTGAYLQRSDNLTLDHTSKQWLLDGAPVRDDNTYHIVMTDFLLLGYDLPILTEDHPGIISIDKSEGTLADDVRTDIRAVIISYFENLN